MTKGLPTRTLLVAAVVPIVAALAGVVLMLAWLPQVPESVAVHWGADAAADGFAPAWAAPVLLAAVGVLVPLLLTGVLLLSPGGGRHGGMQKIVAVSSLWAGLVLAIVLTWTFGAQRGIADPAEAPGPLWPLLAGFGIASAAAVAAWFVLPQMDHAERDTTRTPNPIELAVDERAVWSRRVAAPTAYLVLAGASILLLLGVAVTVGAFTDGGSWALGVLPLVLFLLFATTAVWHVRIDVRGAVVRGVLAVPRFRSLVITTPDAERAAALVNGLRARATLGS